MLDFYSTMCLCHFIFRLDGYLAALQSIRYALLSLDAVVSVANAISRACPKTRTKELLDEIDYYWKGYERKRVSSKMYNPQPRTSYGIMIWNSN